MSETRLGVTMIRDAGDYTEFGTKAASLARLVEAGLPVPDAFCIPASAYRAHAELAEVPRLLSVLLQVPPDAPMMSVAPILQRIRSVIMSAPFDEELVASVRTGMDAIGGGPVSVRSSVTEHDMPSGPLIGRHGTYFASDFDETLRAITHCWSSLWGDPAWRHREASGLTTSDVAVAVVIQKLVPADSSGLVFTADPMTGDRERIVVKSAYGLGESIVAGAVTPDRFVLSRQTLEVEESDINRKRVRLLVDDRGRVAQRAVPAELVSEPSVSDPELVALAQLSLKTEPVVGGEACVEWALSGGTPWLLQARPLVVGR
jgi:phosphoenolpyruvate synthase/pyruvate phosphate dikinase